MCPRCCFEEIIPSLEMTKKAITRYPLRTHSLQFNAFGRTTCIEIAVYTVEVSVISLCTLFEGTTQNWSIKI